MEKSLSDEKVKELMARVEADEEKERQKFIDQLNICDRLMRSAVHTIVDVPFKDDLGDFTVKCRLLTWKEQEVIITLQREIADLKDTLDLEKYKKTQVDFFKFLAYPDGVCVDEKLNLQFWLNGKYGIDVPTRIFNYLMNESRKRIEDAQFFR